MGVLRPSLLVTLSHVQFGGQVITIPLFVSRLCDTSFSHKILWIPGVVWMVHSLWDSSWDCTTWSLTASVPWGLLVPPAPSRSWSPLQGCSGHSESFALVSKATTAFGEGERTKPGGSHCPERGGCCAVAQGSVLAVFAHLTPSPQLLWKHRADLGHWFWCWQCQALKAELSVLTVMVHSCRDEHGGDLQLCCSALERSREAQSCRKPPRIGWLLSWVIWHILLVLRLNWSPFCWPVIAVCLVKAGDCKTFMFLPFIVSRELLFVKRVVQYHAD